MSESITIEISEDRDSGTNAFFAALAASQERGVSESPYHVFFARLHELQKAAEAGEISHWQEKLQEVQDAQEALNFDGNKELEILVQIKKLEMTLLLRASQNALFQSRMEEQKAEWAEKKGEAGDAQGHRNKALKFQRLGKQLQDQLLSKTA